MVIKTFFQPYNKGIKMIDNKYFTFENGIIRVKISADMLHRPMSEIYEIEYLLNEILPESCFTEVIDGSMYFIDPYGDKYPIDENFDTKIY